VGFRTLRRMRFWSVRDTCFAPPGGSRAGSRASGSGAHPLGYVREAFPPKPIGFLGFQKSPPKPRRGEGLGDKLVAPSRRLVESLRDTPLTLTVRADRQPCKTAASSDSDTQQPVQRKSLFRLLNGRREIRQGVPRDGLILHHFVEIPVDPIDAGSQGTGL
jgi:hypothetical protein